MRPFLKFLCPLPAQGEGEYVTSLPFAGFKAMFLACGLVALLTIAFPRESRAAITSLSYDASGNQISQQAATAAAPIILGSPSSQIVLAGGTVSFSVNVASALPVTHQWYFNGAAISGATGDSLLLTNVSSANEGDYTVTITNNSGSVTSGIYRLGVDLNGNGLPDSWELTYFDNLDQTPDGDYDGDGISNLDEFLNGTDPASALSGPIPLISDVAISGGNIRITFPTLINHTYQLQQADTPSSANWEDVGVAQSGTGGLIEFVVPIEGTRKFYRVKITPWP